MFDVKKRLIQLILMKGRKKMMKKRLLENAQAASGFFLRVFENRRSLGSSRTWRFHSSIFRLFGGFLYSFGQLFRANSADNAMFFGLVLVDFVAAK